MIIGFLSNKITNRGTEVNLFDYADFNETILGNKSIVITRPYDHVMQVSPRDVTCDAYDKFINRFDKIEYYINPSDVNEIILRNKIDVLFIEKAGSPSDDLIYNSCKTIIHAVFTTKEPHGDLYAPISDSLNKMCGTNYPILPYMVRVFDTDENLRQQLQIPENAIVFGAYCGADEYNIDYVRKAIIDISNDPQYSNIYFIFMNIIPFCAESEHIRFLPGTCDMKMKRMFINTCNAMLYGRAGGETFGLACGEFSICNKPVIGRAQEHSCAHIDILGDDMIKHNSYDELIDIITNWSKYNKDVSNNGYKQYTPLKVMQNFQKHLTQLLNPYEKNTIIFTTAFKDIGRKDWHIIPRSNERYIQDFLNLANNINYKLIVYVEDNMYNILQTYNLKSNIILINSNSVNTFFDMYIENERHMITSHEYKRKIPKDREDAPEHWCAEYNMVNHSKINYLVNTKKLFPNYEYYSWIDFGCIRNTINDVPKDIDFNKLDEKICYMTLKTPTHFIDANEILISHDVYFAGSQNVIHYNLVNITEYLWKTKLEEWKTRIICDEDQDLVLQLYFDNPDLFKLYPSNTWFSLFSNHLNSKITLNNKNDFHRIINLNIMNRKYTKYIEIGVARGEFTNYILENTSLDKLYLIDPYRNFTIDEYTDGMNYYDMEFEYNFCRNRLSKYNDRIEFIRKTSEEAVSQFIDESIDIIYIDGNHSYKYVMQDLELYWPKVKTGGLLIGDDLYEYSENKDILKIWDGKTVDSSISFGVYGVHAALVDFSKKYNVSYHIFSNQFIIYKA